MIDLKHIFPQMLQEVQEHTRMNINDLSKSCYIDHCCVLNLTALYS